MSKLEIRYLLEEEYVSWDSFVDETEEGTIYHTSVWNKALFKGVKGVSFSVLACFNADKKIVGGIAFGWKKVYGVFKIIVIPYASPFSGLLISKRNTDYVSKQENHSFSLIDDLLAYLEKDFHVLSFSFSTKFKDIRPLNWNRYTSKVFYTYIGDISKPEALLSSFLPDIRRRIKIAEKLDYKIREEKTDAHLRSVYGLLSKSFERQNHHFNFGEGQFIEICQTPELAENILVFSIWKEETPVATLIIIVDKNTCYYWMAGGDSEHFDTGLNQLLFWNVIQKLSKKGVTEMDMTGANTLTISKYKSSYNFRLHPYYYVSKENGTIIRFLFSLKRVIKGGAR